MSVDLFPTGVSSPGNNTWLWSPTKITTLAGLTAGTVVDLSCYFPASEVEIGFDQSRDDDTRGCDAATRESFGTVSYSRDELVHIVNPQGTGTEDGNKALGAVLPNSSGFIYLRMGIPHGTTPIAAHKWDEYRVATGGDHITPLSQGKYLRRVKTSWTKERSGISFAS